MKSMFVFYEGLSQDLFTDEIPQILLLHANNLNADIFHDLINMMRSRGYSFISLREALSHPAYSSPDTYTGPIGISWLQRWAISRGQSFRKEPDLLPLANQFDKDIRASGRKYKTQERQ